MIVVDPRFYPHWAKADEYVRIRSGTTSRSCLACCTTSSKRLGRQKYIHDRVFGMDKAREEVLPGPR